ncbi:hypothetical protein [Streptomyces sp. ISL-11]|uniref:hypothetical protein n=1 Tax=Streptomyces sp. ISL-11 TaxID=2819174 RepID=UPI001BE74B88|nr:hypothetical protein [Streptomyces sp. ISL-11]MBT2383774.1 hypothetical protein [Streptomyces sp. ISL-11]
MSEPLSHPDHAAHPHGRRRRRWPWVLLAVVILLAGGCAVLVVGLSNEADKTVRVTYEVTGDARRVNIAYSTWQDGERRTRQEEDRPLPWRKELRTKGFAKGGLLAVTVGPDGGTATCSVRIDDGDPRTDTASGASATATCTGF